MRLIYVSQYLYRCKIMGKMISRGIVLALQTSNVDFVINP